MHRQTKTKQQFKTITTMTKEELSAKIAQGEYTDCKMDGKYSVSFKIGDANVSVAKIGSSIIAMTVISTDVSEDDYKKIIKQALNNELESVKTQEKELMKSINAL